MTNLYFGMLRDGVPADEKVVRSTTAPYSSATPPAVMDSMPDQQEVATDPNPELGLANRQLASHWVQGTKGVQEWQGRADSAHLHNDIIDRQVASSGTAAAREAAGQWGHGTMSYAVGIAPVGDLVDGQKMGNEYFVRDDRDIQATSDNTMMAIPPGYDTGLKGSVMQSGKDGARDAATSAYDVMWKGGN